MTTLIAVYTNRGCIGRCDAKCHDAFEPECICVCGGVNHGVGLSRAIKNTDEMSKHKIEKIAKEFTTAKKLKIKKFKHEKSLFDWNL